MDDALFLTQDDLFSLFPENESGLPYQELLDRVEERIVKMGGEIQEIGEEIFPLNHRFTPKMYIREITMPKGAVITSKTHKYEHPFVVSKGHCMVFQEDGGWREIKAPYTGITKSGTRRLLVILEETIWTTFHVTDLTDICELETTLWETWRNPRLGRGESA